MPLKRRHKIVIGSFSSILIVILIANTVLIYALYVQLQINHNKLENEIMELQADTQNKINELTTSLIETKEGLGKLDVSLSMEIGELKASTGEDFSGIAENAVKSVVTIRTDRGQGTGFIITDEGYLVTNAHLLNRASKVDAITYEQDTINANFIGYEGDLDIALLKIPGKYNPLELANSNNVQIGEKVIAIGNPLGLQFSISEGIVSGVHRQGINELEAYIQTDAALNPGSSGGPLINKKGEVIGINNFKIGGVESLGFALESNFIRDAVNIISQQALNQTLI